MVGMSAHPPMPQRLARRLLPFARSRKHAAQEMPAFAVHPDDIQTLEGPASFRETLLALIKQAKCRIVLVALYLQDDDAGREVFEALHAAYKANPALDIEVYVDWHRARRGLIGNATSEGNAAMYREYAAKYGDGVAVYGVPVQNRELFGVLHVKGFIIDDDVLYSGASINDVYLARHTRYRLDRYHLIHHAGLATSMVRFAKHYLAESAAVTRLDRRPLPSTRDLQPAIRHLRRSLQRAHYATPHAIAKDGDVAVTPLVGFGRSGNQLNDVLLTLLRRAQRRVVIFTPYFNLPRQVRAIVGHLLRRGCVIDIMVGDKTANDFYIPPEEPFRKIGLLPYLYENNLRRFARNHRAHMLRGQLNLWLWRDSDNSFHLKGLLIDEEIAVITGNNLNPRAWALDLENGLLLRDPSCRLTAQHEAEWAALRRHAVRLDDYHALDNPRRYPAEVRTLLRRLRRVRLDRLLNRLL
jgi:CDP-diacylglycerol--serine O-phosphatidyltransferase